VLHKKQSMELELAETDHFVKYWAPVLNEPLPVLQKSKKHRNKIACVENIQLIKNYIQKKLHPIAVHEFLRLYGMVNPDSMGNYPNVEKGLVILYQFMTGMADKAMPIYYTTFHRISKGMWKKKKLEEIERWSEDWMRRLSSPGVRMAHSRTRNPPALRNITLIVDGKDVGVILSNVEREKRIKDNGKTNLSSFKLNFKNAARQQVMIDCRRMTVSISDTVGANEESDGIQCEKMLQSWEKM
jgi:hypothetical protein